MKFILISLLVFAGLFAFAFSADCELDGHLFNKGEKYSKKGECTEYTCAGPGSISALTCPESVAPDTCKEIPQDNSKPYPQCCKSYDCTSKGDGKCRLQNK